MRKSKVAITLDSETVQRLDRLVKNRIFRSRSSAIQDAVRDKLDRIDRNRLARECAKLDPALEKAMAEEGAGEELAEWPEY